MKGVSRRREKKKRLRRDARVGLSRGKWFLRPRDQLFLLLKRVSRRREKKGRLRRDARVCYHGITRGIPRNFRTFVNRSAAFLFSQTVPN